MAISKDISAGDRRRLSPLALGLVGMIRLYRLVLSPVVGHFVSCRHWPTCSEYGLEAVQRHGAVRGGGMAIRRVLRCNPFFPGGYDPVQ